MRLFVPPQHLKVAISSVLILAGCGKHTYSQQIDGDTCQWWQDTGIAVYRLSEDWYEMTLYLGDSLFVFEYWHEPAICRIQAGSYSIDSFGVIVLYFDSLITRRVIVQRETASAFYCYPEPFSERFRNWRLSDTTIQLDIHYREGINRFNTYTLERK